VISAFDLVSVVDALADETLESDERNDLIERIDAALAVAGAVEWCRVHLADIGFDDFGDEGPPPVRVTIPIDLDADKWETADGKTLVEAVAALAKGRGDS